MVNPLDDGVFAFRTGSCKTRISFKPPSAMSRQLPEAMQVSTSVFSQARGHLPASFRDLVLPGGDKPTICTSANLAFKHVHALQQ